MFVMEAATPLVTLNPQELLIAGIAWYVFVMLCIIFLLMAFVIFIFGKQRRMWAKHREEVRGCVILAVLPTTGGTIPIDFALCKYHKSEAKMLEDTSSGTFTSTGWAEAPKGHAIDRYLLPDEHDYCMAWPVWAPPSEQVIAPVYIVHKNFQWPECPHDGKKWDTMRIIQTSAAMNALAKNESSMQAIMSPQMAFAQILDELVKKFKWVPIAAICAGGAAAVALINLAVNWLMVGQRVDFIVKWIQGTLGK